MDEKSEFPTQSVPEKVTAENLKVKTQSELVTADIAKLDAESAQKDKKAIREVRDWLVGRNTRERQRMEKELEAKGKDKGQSEEVVPDKMSDDSPNTSGTKDRPRRWGFFASTIDALKAKFGFSKHKAEVRSRKQEDNLDSGSYDFPSTSETESANEDKPQRKGLLASYIHAIKVEFGFYQQRTEERKKKLEKEERRKKETEPIDYSKAA